MKSTSSFDFIISCRREDDENFWSMVSIHLVEFNSAWKEAMSGGSTCIGMFKSITLWLDEAITKRGSSVIVSIGYEKNASDVLDLQIQRPTGDLDDSAPSLPHTV